MSDLLSQSSSKSYLKSSLSKKKKNNDIYTPSIITKSINLNLLEVDDNIGDTLQKKLSDLFEGKCGIEGFIKNNSIKIITFSCGQLKANYIMFKIVFECLICHPVEGMRINCVVKDITKAGIRASLPNGDNSLIIFIARDHHSQSPKFSQIKINEDIKVKVLGQRFELNDTNISVIAELVYTKDSSQIISKSPKLILKD